ncbi:MAG: MtnX-like HAD-IB family phosphatase [Opitutaceae bacterium]
MSPSFQVFIDFDNTISRGDVLDAIIERFAVDNRWRKLEEAWVAGRIGARDCLDGQLRLLEGTQGEFEEFFGEVELDPGFTRLVELLHEAKVELTIVSDNFDRFIEAILRRFGHADIPLLANHVEFSEGKLLPSFPHYNPVCPGCAHCKKTHFVPRRDQRRVIYVGDGRSDICPAGHADIVFAKSSLLTYLQRESVPCVAFEGLDDVVAALQKLLHEDKS